MEKRITCAICGTDFISITKGREKYCINCKKIPTIIYMKKYQKEHPEIFRNNNKAYRKRKLLYEIEKAQEI